MTLAPERTAPVDPSVLRAPGIYEGSRIPDPIPTMLLVDPEVRETGDVLQINFGPNHPSMHGVLRLVVDLNGETVVGLRAVIGYLHTGFEKNMEQKTWWKAITYPERIDYVSFQNNELVFVLAIEKLLGLETPPKATWMRMLLCELNRIHSHRSGSRRRRSSSGRSESSGTRSASASGSSTSSSSSGARGCTRATSRQAGSPRTSRPGSIPECRQFIEGMPKAVDQYETLLTRNQIWLKRTVGVGLLSAEDAAALGQSGPVLRASGIDWDLRRDQPYLTYGDVEFDVPVYTGGDVYDRYRVHMDEMRESVRIVEQCLDRLEQMEGEPWIADDRKVVLPPRDELHTSMESLIHHFKIVTEGYRVPEGEVYVTAESPRGEMGCSSCPTAGQSRGG